MHTVAILVQACGYSLSLLNPKMAFTFQTQLVITGGNLKKPWTPELQDVQVPEEHHFYRLQRRDRRLAAAIGANLSSSHPLQHNKAISLIIKLRDEAVDNCITSSVEVDPLADARAAMIPQGQRQRPFRAAGVPEVISVKLPDIILADNTVVEAVDVLVCTTARRSTPPVVALTPDILQWMTLVKDTDIDHVPSKCANNSWWEEIGELPELEPPLKYRKRSCTLSIYCDYWTLDGQKKSHQQTVTSRVQVISKEQLDVMIAQTCEDMYKFVNEHCKGAQEVSDTGMGEDTAGSQVTLSDSTPEVDTGMGQDTAGRQSKLSDFFSGECTCCR